MVAEVLAAKAVETEIRGVYPPFFEESQRY